jgi:hypothetical protein
MNNENNNEMEIVAVSPSNGVIATLEGISSLEIQLGKKPSTNIKQPIEQPIYNTFPYAFWGPDNQAPAYYDKLISENSSLSGAIHRRIDKLIAGGIEYGFLDDSRNFIPKFDEEIERFMEQPQIAQYINQGFLDYTQKMAIMPLFTFNQPKTKLLHFSTINAGEVRWQKQNPETGLIDFAYWSKNWHFQLGLGSSYLEYPVIDEMYHSIDQIRAESNAQYIYRCQIPGSGTYYQTPVWMSSVLQGWYEHSMQIPEWYNALMKHLTTIQFEVCFKVNYLKTIYGEVWENASPKRKIELMQERLDNIADSIQGPKNAGKFIANLQYYDRETHQYEKGWTLIEVPSKQFSGEHLKNLQEADQHIIWSVGEDPISMGSHGTGSEAGSGSGKKAAFNGDVSTNQIHANIFLSPFYFAKRYNGWDTRLKFRIRLPYLADLNQVSMEKRNNGYQDQNKPAQ